MMYICGEKERLFSNEWFSCAPMRGAIHIFMRIECDHASFTVSGAVLFLRYMTMGGNITCVELNCIHATMETKFSNWGVILPWLDS
jgi:hypothetical protein